MTPVSGYIHAEPSPRSFNTRAPGGSLVTITTSDGQTVCYQVVVEGNGHEHYETAGGQEFATLAPSPDGGFAVTCEGTTVVVDINDPTCATQNGTACVSGTCF